MILVVEFLAGSLASAFQVRIHEAAEIVEVFWQ